MAILLFYTSLITGYSWLFMVVDLNLTVSILQSHANPSQTKVHSSISDLQKFAWRRICPNQKSIIKILHTLKKNSLLSKNNPRRFHALVLKLLVVFLAKWHVYWLYPSALKFLVSLEILKRRPNYIINEARTKTRIFFVAPSFNC